jgi:tRNA guanosine-2'-O-methyltransferase
MSAASTSLDLPMLQEIWRFLNENTDINKMCRKQMSFFETYNLSSKCTVRGLLSIHCDEWGERIPPHILNILLQSVRDGDGSESNVGGTNFATTINRNYNFVDNDDQDASASGDTAQQLQTKITPFDNLQLAIESSILTRQNTSTDRPRQDLIVVASLIDKVTNLAGIARTCEIFAAKELVLSDLSVVKSHDFQSISVASAGWMPMREVAYRTNQSREMICYLREMKSKGYQIVGIEQTGVSVGLSNTTPLAARCLIVLGKEKEGIPVELLGEMDLCIEIPQYGLTRSLNVHVSAALVIWEATKRNMKLS